jgi:hypothetical protein
MRDLDLAEIAAIQAGTVVARNLVWLTAITRDTGEPVDIGFWDGGFDATLSVKDGRSGNVVERLFYGGPELLDIDSIPLTSDISIRNVDIRLSQIASSVQLFVRGYDVRSAPIQIYRGYFDQDTRELVAPAKARFIGYVDQAPIETPAEGQEGSCTLRCVSTTRELTRTSPEVRSHESQLVRSGGTDAFYKDVATVGDWDIAWGVNRTKPSNK